MLADPISHVEVVLKDCSPKELVIAEGKCSRYVNDLIFLTEEYKSSDVTLEIAKNITQVCQTIKSCFGDIQCKEAQRNKDLYEVKCEKLDFENYEMDRCIGKFYDQVYMANNSCTKDFDYFSKDMSVKRIAYTSGKSCLLGIAKNNCTEKALTYLNSNYEEFLNILTTPPKDKKCNSLHDQLIGMQCDPPKADMFSNVLIMPFSMMTGKKPELNDTSSACDKLKDCMEGSCYASTKNSTERLNDLCSSISVSSDGFGFLSCYLQLKFSSDLKEYDCLPPGMNSTTFFSSKSVPSFYDDKECAKTVMKGECGKGAVKDFDKEWAEVLKVNQEFDQKRNATDLSTLI